MPSSGSSSGSDSNSFTPALRDHTNFPEANEKISLKSTRPLEISTHYTTPPTTATASEKLASKSPKSTKSAQSSAAPAPPGLPKQRFQNSLHRIIKMHRASSMMIPGYVGAEPGIDPRRASANAHYGHLHRQCVIEVVDYSVDQCSFGRMTNRELVEMLQDPVASEREPWARVRWINVGGLSWDVISALALRYDMHPLAVEDVLHQHGHARSKSDYYPKHLFLRLLCHRLGSEDELLSPDAALGYLPVDPSLISRIESPEPLEERDDKGCETTDEDHTVHGSPELRGAGPSRFSPKSKWDALKRSPGTMAVDVEAVDAEKHRPRPTEHSSWSPSLLHLARKKQKHAQDWKLIQKLKKGERVNVKVNPVCIFLFRDGTVISISQDSNLDFTAPIRDRLCQADTGLRMTADPSLLVESLIDLIVDQALEVVEEYQGKILKIEKQVLIKPDIKTVTSLHMLQEDLILHKRTLEPIKTLVYGLRQYDADRATAIMENGGVAWDSATRPVGFMSDKARIYLADVYDHLEYIIMSLDMFASISDNLINYICNMVSYQMNEVMRRLTIITIIFLPLSFLSGYFGMNFPHMWSVYSPSHTDLFFWEIALPVMGFVIPFFMWPDLKRVAHHMEKRVVKRRVQKTYKQD